MEFSWQNYVWLIYFAVVLGAFVLVFWWRFNRCKTRLPLGEDIKLSRQPGEYLRLELDKFFERFLWRLAVLFVVPAVVGLAILAVMGLIMKHWPVWSLALPVAGLLVSLGFCLRGILAIFDLAVNQRLGWFGERAVADQLEGLKKQGYDVFHDVPCLGGSGPFNLDHVVVGRGVVVVVETKTIRKPKDDKEGHRVTYNGEALVWPWGKSTRELEQVQRNAEWLRKDLLKHVNVDTVVQPALTMPGWFVTGGPPHSPVLVESYKRLPKFIVQRFPARLTETETNLVAKRLSGLCSNLGYADLA